MNQTLTHVENTLVYREWFAKDAASALLIGNLDHYAQSTVLTPMSAPGINFYLIDQAKAQAVLVDHPEWFRMSNRTADNNAAFYQLRESITAVYGQIGWRSDASRCRPGIRYDSTDVTVGNLNKTVAGGVTSYPFLERGAITVRLPSAVASWNMTDRLNCAAGISETIGRPDYGQYGATTTIRST